MRYASTILSQGVQMMEYFAAHAHVPGARQISARDKRVTALLPTDQIRMTLESQPLVPGSWLAVALNEVTTALDNIDYGDGFVSSIAALSAAIEKAIPVLEERVIEPDESVDKIVADLERSLFISIVAPLTAHNPILPLVDKMDERAPAISAGKYPLRHGSLFRRQHAQLRRRQHAQLRRRTWAGACPHPAPGVGLRRRHDVLCGWRQSTSVEHHPEIQAVVYAQWFTYAFAIWEEQFRGRLAKYWDS